MVLHRYKLFMVYETNRFLHQIIKTFSSIFSSFCSLVQIAAVLYMFKPVKALSIAKIVVFYLCPKFVLSDGYRIFPSPQIQRSFRKYKAALETSERLFHPQKV